MYWALCAYMGAVSFIMALSEAATGFGNAILFYLFYFSALYVYPGEFHSFFGEHDMKEVNVILAAWALLTYFPQAFVARHGVRKDVVVLYFPAQLVGSGLGAVLAMKLSSDILRTSFGCVLLCVAGVQGFVVFRRTVHDFREELTGKYKVGLFFSSLCSGCSSGLFGAGGPPMMIFMLWSRLHKSITRGSFAICEIGSTTVRISVLAYYGAFHFDSWEHYTVFGIMGLTAYAAIPVGNRIHYMLSPRTFSIIILFFLVMATLVLMKITPPVVLGVGAAWAMLFIGMAVHLHFFAGRKRKDNDGNIGTEGSHGVAMEGPAGPLASMENLEEDR